MNETTEAPAPQAEKPRRYPTPREYICALIETFPCLKGRINSNPATWDCDKLGKELGVLSSGERYAALFILNVWNPAYARDNGWIFDVVEVCGCWGTNNRQAFMNWVANPYWP